MHKIPTVFVRDHGSHTLTDTFHPDAVWVANGEGIATRKYDGTCVVLGEDGAWRARREVKAGKLPPPGFELIQYDSNTGKSVGWEPVSQSSFAKFHAEALANADQPDKFAPGTYELLGPKINGNPECMNKHVLIAHETAEELSEFKIGEEDGFSRDFATIRGTVAVYHRSGYEGIVYHHPDGRMAKIKVRDFPAGSL